LSGDLERELEELAKRDPAEALRLVIRAFKPGELLKAGNRSFVNAFRYPESRFDLKELAQLMPDGGGLRLMQGGPDMLQPLRDPLKTFSDQFVVPPDYVVFKVKPNIYARSGLTGQVEFSGSDASSVLQGVFDALASHQHGVVAFGMGAGGASPYDYSFEMTKTVYAKSPVSMIGLGNGKTNFYPDPTAPMTNFVMFDFKTYGGWKYLIMLDGVRFDNADRNGTSHQTLINFGSVPELHVFRCELKGTTANIDNIASWGIIADNILYAGSWLNITQVDDLRIVGNIVDGFFQFGSGTTAGLAKNILVCGNIFKAQRSWLTFWQAYDSLVVGNYFINAPWRAVRAWGACQRIKILDNYFYIASGQTNIIALEATPNQVGVTIKGNVFENPTPPVLTPGGTGLVIRGNIGYPTESYGIATFSGDGETKVFSVSSHGLAESPSDRTRIRAYATPQSADAESASPVSAYPADLDGDGNYEGLKIAFASPPPPGTNNVAVKWYAELDY
jgi:hypothetical protein